MRNESNPEASSKAPLNVSVTATIAAPADAVYELISDVTRMPEFSPENIRGEWLGSATGPVGLALHRRPEPGDGPSASRVFGPTTNLAAASDLIDANTAVSSAQPSGASSMINEPDDRPLADDQLRLILLCCHPALDPHAQVALTLRLVGGLTTSEIAAGLLVQEATLAQRIVRAKRKIRDAGIPLTIPHDLATRVDVVLGVLYLIFNEGYLSRSSGMVVRIDLFDEAIRLTQTLAGIVDEQPEVLGLLALQHFHRARSATRADQAGELILLEDQDRTRWDLQEIAVAEGFLARALRRMQPGPYQVQAIIARHHATARTAADTDWPAIVAAYRQLVAMTDSPVVRLNCAVAIAMADGAHAGLAAVEQIGGLDHYHLFHATRGELLARAGRLEDAAGAFTTAITLTANDAERRHLSRRRNSLR